VGAIDAPQNLLEVELSAVYSDFATSCQGEVERIFISGRIPRFAIVVIFLLD